MVTVSDIEAAAQRIAPWLRPTPLLENALLNERAGRRVLLKAESLNVTGSFKIRGALNTLLQLDESERAAGVVAFSSGNHAQGVARAAAWLGTSAVIVMPADAPAIKRRNTERLGARVVPYDRQRESREEIGADIRDREGRALIAAFDDPRIIAGQGTAGLEAAAEADALGAAPALVAAPCGGGGMIAGVGLALRARFPECRLIAVEPDAYDDTARSLAAGERVSVDTSADSICDALLAPRPGEITFAINRNQLSGAVQVSDREVLGAMRFAATQLKCVVEPGGATALAALLEGKLGEEDSDVLLILSGGNVDPQMLERAMRS